MISLDSCLLIVDVQKGFINDFTKHIPPLVENIQYKYKHLIVTRFYNPENSFYRKLLKWNRFDIYSDDFSLAFNVRKDALIIDKSVYSCVSLELLKWLKNRNINEVHIAGIDTDICVTKCAVDLFENDIKPVVISNLCASYAGIEAHKMGLLTLTLERFIGQIISIQI